MPDPRADLRAQAADAGATTTGAYIEYLEDVILGTDGNPFCSLRHTIERIKEQRSKCIDYLQYWMDDGPVSQRNLAAGLGISPQYLSDILRRRRPLSDEMVETIASFFEDLQDAGPNLREGEGNEIPEVARG